jgi:deuterolysin
MADDDFELIPAGSSIEVTFDVAELHDLSVGGAYSVHSSGALSFAEADSNKLIGSVPYDSKNLKMDVDGEAASITRIEFHAKRARIQNSCTGSRLTASRNALNRCVPLARAAQKAALSGPANKMNEFYKSSSSSTRNQVATVFSRVATECSSTNSGVSAFYCSDPYNVCQGSVLAYTVPTVSLMAYCPSYFKMSAASTYCHGQDQGNTILHEATHLRQIKGTDDYGGYGYNFVRGLSAAQNLNHADTYTLFAQSVSRGC